MTPLAKLIQDLRKQNGWSLIETAGEIGVSNFLLAQVEKGQKQLTPYYLLKMADLFDIPFAELAVKSFVIDEYTDAAHVRWVFEQFDLEPDSWIHIRSVDNMQKEEIEGMKQFWAELNEKAQRKPLKEITAAEKLEAFRNDPASMVKVPILSNIRVVDGEVVGDVDGYIDTPEYIIQESLRK